MFAFSIECLRVCDADMEISRVEARGRGNSERRLERKREERRDEERRDRRERCWTQGKHFRRLPLLRCNVVRACGNPYFPQNP